MSNPLSSFPEKLSVVQRRCDNVSVFGFYAMAFFLPISPAIVESCFGFVLLPHLIKHTFLFIFNLKVDGVMRRKPLHFFRIFAQSYKPISNILNVPIAVYTAICLLSILLSKYPLVGMKGFVFKLMEGLFIYFVFIESMQTKRRLRIFLAILFISASVMSFDGVFQYLARFDFIHHHPVTDGRITGPFKHANDFGGYLVMLLPLIASLSVFFRWQHTPQGSLLGASVNQWGFLSTKYFRYCMTGLFLMAVFSLGVTFSRGAWLAFIVGMIVLGLKRPKVLLLTFFLLFVFVTVFVPKMMAERTTNIVSSILDSSSRGIYWTSAMNLIVKSPFIGHGLNAYTPAAEANNLKWQGYPHNCFLQMLAEVGLFGLVSFIWIFLRLFRQAWRRVTNIQDLFSKDVVWGAAAGLTAFMVHSFFDTSMYSGQLSSLMWLITGVAVAVMRVEKGSERNVAGLPDEETLRFPLKVWIGIIAVMVLLGINFTQKIQPSKIYGEVFYRLGMQCEGECDPHNKVEYFEKAIYYDPQYVDAYYQLGMAYRMVNNYFEAFKKFEQAYALSGGKHYEAAYQLGVHYFRHGDLDKALHLFEPIIEKVHMYKLTHYYIGRCYELKGNYVMPEWYYERTTLYIPSFVPGYLRHGILFALQGDWKKVAEIAEKLEALGHEEEGKKLRQMLRGAVIDFEIYEDFNCTNLADSPCRQDWGQVDVIR